MLEISDLTERTYNIKSMKEADKELIQEITSKIVKIISETNGISLSDTLSLACQNQDVQAQVHLLKHIEAFRRLLANFQQDEVDINTLINHPVGLAIFEFLKHFPLKYREEHIHLTGSLTAEFIYPRLKKLLEGPKKELYEQKIKEVYGNDSIPIRNIEDVDNLIRLKEGEFFDRYLQILYLPKLILLDRKVHEEAAYSMAETLWDEYNVGFIRLKFTLSRVSTSSSEDIPGIENLSPEDVVLGLYHGFKKFQKKHPEFDFILSPSFRKEPYYFDQSRFSSKQDDFLHQVQDLLDIIDKYPELQKYVCEVDTVGNERDLYRKSHFHLMKYGFRKLHYKGFLIRSHHGETWYTLRKGIQAVDNAMNIWHIETLEHGLSLGINPNYYFHSLFQRVLKMNSQSKPLKMNSAEYNEICDMDWSQFEGIKEKLIAGVTLTQEEQVRFTKIKFHTAREVEHYQHDVLNRMIQKQVSLTALPSSNKKLTKYFEDYKDHPFDWWEKKGVKLGVGTDNYITLNTNFIQEMLILLFTDPYNLKITKLLMVTTGVKHRPYISQLYWQMQGIKI